MNNGIFESNGWNVINEADFKDRVIEIFSRVSDTLVKTLGPYGKTTVIEKHGNFHITKDGWTVLKNIRFANPIDNNIMQMIYEIAAQVVIKVGDGSTSAIVGANEMLKSINNSNIMDLRSKDFIDRLTRCVELICNNIVKNASIVNKEGSFDEIYNLALIATNDNEEIAGIIRDIYANTNNPSIDFASSKTNKTTYEIIEGYKLPLMTYIDAIFVTGDDQCVVDSPMLLMMDFRLDHNDLVKKILALAKMFAKEQGRKLVVVTPFYDKMGLEYVKRDVMGEFKTTHDIPTIYTRVSIISNMSETLYSDFAAMTGGNIIKESDFLDIESDQDMVKIIEEGLGKVDKMVIGKDYTTISGFSNRDENLYNLTVNDAKSKYDSQMAKDMEKNIITTDSFELKRRVSKLSCKMGIIQVGGMSELSKEANKDLVEDAVKACESAYHYGYNKGCNLAILTSVNEIKTEMKECNGIYDYYDFGIMDLISNAFKGVYLRVLSNKFLEKADADDNLMTESMNRIIDYSICLGKCYNLITDDYSDEIINPCYTDIELLKATTSIISLIVSSNQYISIIIKEAN